MKTGEEYIWAQKYRPKTIDECIIIDELKDRFQNFVEKGDLYRISYFMEQLVQVKPLLQKLYWKL